MKASLLNILLLIFLTSCLDTASQLFLKSSINSLGLQIKSLKKIFSFVLRLIRLPGVWFGWGFSALSLMVWLFVLSKAELNFAFSVDSMHYILITLASVLILKEKVSPIRWLGIAAIVCGITLVAVS